MIEHLRSRGATTVWEPFDITGTSAAISQYPREHSMIIHFGPRSAELDDLHCAAARGCKPIRHDERTEVSTRICSRCVVTKTRRGLYTLIRLWAYTTNRTNPLGQSD